ncbi:MarR family winged helix-turn-helix transcriptional regulator [Frateuria sp. STR12]|uniref:MarR family winged helix-turn-helix transcriptional regulator n=1 Tax=Frateuria hangzhouensis TaxID=2995589 RepID=UPI002260EE5A|nr:MarR family transcriptional regulator [Frateuria sp. STR12]MCX7512226.1 MarR family transcriptional regulator [Frateuria sp. STR12]
MAHLGDCIGMMDQGIEQVSLSIPGMPAAEARLTRLLLMVAHRVDEILEGELKPHRINHSDFLTMMFLYSRPEGASTPGELCEFTSLGATNMTRIANALVERGLIKRGPSDQDRRRVEIRITPAGRRFVQKLLPGLFPPCGAAFAGFSEADKRSFSRLLRKLADNLDRLDAAPAPKDAR